MLTMFYVLIGIMFFVNLTFAFMPYLTRKTESFGVAIPEEIYHREDVKSMRKKYAISLILINLVFMLGFVIASFYVTEQMLTIIFTTVIILYLLVSFLYYLPFHFKMKKLKETENWYEKYKQTIVVDPKFREEKLTYSNAWFLIPFAITLFSIIYTFIVYEQIPDQLPMHRSFSGGVTYDEKSLGNLLVLPVTQLFMIGIFVLINFIIKQSKQQIHAAKPTVSKKQNVLFRRRWSLFLIVVSIVMSLMFFYIQLSFIYPSLSKYEDVVIFTFIGIILLATIGLSVFTGQGGSRIKVEEAENEPHIERDDDKYWKLGQFYFNKDDPAIFIEKRFGIGWTNNWAHPISWLLLIGVVGLAILIPLLISLL